MSVYNYSDPTKVGKDVIRIARSSKGRLKTHEETVSIKLRLDKTTAEQLRECAEKRQVPMATIIRQGISRIISEELQEEKEGK